MNKKETYGIIGTMDTATLPAAGYFSSVAKRVWIYVGQVNQNVKDQQTKNYL